MTGPTTVALRLPRTVQRAEAGVPLFDRGARGTMPRLDEAAAGSALPSVIAVDLETNA